MTLHLPPEEPSFGPWEVRPIPAFVQSIQAAFSKDMERPGIVAIDGRSAGGKTTLAALINKAVPGSVVVHTDDIPSSNNWPSVDAYSPSHVDSAVQRSFFDWTERFLENCWSQRVTDKPCGIDLRLGMTGSGGKASPSKCRRAVPC